MLTILTANHLLGKLLDNVIFNVIAAGKYAVEFNGKYSQYDSSE